MRLTIFAVRPWTLQVKLNYQRLEGDPDPESDLNPPGRLKIRLGQKYLPGAVFQCAVIFGSATCGNWDIVLFPISYEPPVTEEEKVCMSQDEYKRIGLLLGANGIGRKLYTNHQQQRRRHNGRISQSGRHLHERNLPLLRHY